MQAFRIVLGLLLAAWSFTAQAVRFDLPWGGEWKPDFNEVVRATFNPMSVVLPTGLPTAQSLTLFVLQNPDYIAKVARDPSYAAYMPVADAITEGRNAALSSGTHRIPPEIRN